MPGKSRPLLLLVALFLALPFVAGTALYFSGWRPAGTANRGILIVPPAAVAASEAARSEWQGKWSLLLIHDGPCGAPCVERLDGLRRLRLSLGRHRERTRLVWIGTAIAAEAALVKAEMPDLAIRERYPERLEALAPGSIVLVDPQGRAMMRYPPGADLKDLRADLQHLLQSVRSV